jgi:hypothetical protein
MLKIFLNAFYEQNPVKIDWNFRHLASSLAVKKINKTRKVIVSIKNNFRFI